jgi:thymidylate synthase
VCAWNPKDLSKMSLPPCHLLFQFYVEGEYLSCQLYQRSGDIMLGIPYNIASYSALVYMIAHVCGKKPKKFIHIIGDSHIYKNHIVGAEEQIKRNPKVFPTLKFTREITDINDFQLSDFELENYNCHPSIKFDLAI